MESKNKRNQHEIPKATLADDTYGKSCTTWSQTLFDNIGVYFDL